MVGTPKPPPPLLLTYELPVPRQTYKRSERVWSFRLHDWTIIENLWTCPADSTMTTTKTVTSTVLTHRTPMGDLPLFSFQIFGEEVGQKTDTDDDTDRRKTESDFATWKRVLVKFYRWWEGPQKSDTCNFKRRTKITKRSTKTSSLTPRTVSSDKTEEKKKTI